jgi:hypothetical protein
MPLHDADILESSSRSAPPSPRAMCQVSGNAIATVPTAISFHSQIAKPPVPTTIAAFSTPGIN